MSQCSRFIQGEQCKNEAELEGGWCSSCKETLPIVKSNNLLWESRKSYIYKRLEELKKEARIKEQVDKETEANVRKFIQ